MGPIKYAHMARLNGRESARKFLDILKNMIGYNGYIIGFEGTENWSVATLEELDDDTWRYIKAWALEDGLLAN